MTAFDIGPFQNIVNVGWGGAFAAVRIHKEWTGANGPGPSGASIALPGFPPLPIPPIAIRAGLWTTDNIVAGSPLTITSTNYDYTVTFSRFPDSGSGSGHAIVTTDGSHTFWSTDGGGAGVGGIDAVEAFLLANGWDTFAAVETGSGTSSSPGAASHTGQSNEVWLFDVRKLRPFVVGPTFTIRVVTGFPNGVEGGPAVTYGWTVDATTYRSATKDSFPLDSHALPDHWRTPTASASLAGNANETRNLVIDFATLALS